MALGLSNWCLSKAGAGDRTAQDLSFHCFYPCNTENNSQVWLPYVGSIRKGKTLTDTWKDLS